MELQIQDFSHTHQFAVYTTEEEDDDDDLCSMCQVHISGPAYRCSGCYFLMHKSCAELPREIEHPFHPQHPLVLLPNPPYKSGNYCCDTCRKQREYFTFHCYKCGFDLDIKCASIAPIENETQIQLTTHTHQHLLILCTKDQKFDFDCSCCELPLEGSIYVCFQCRLLLHPSCAELPKEIKHLLHPLHPLTLLPRAPHGQFRCCVCRKSRRGFTFQCNECGFYLDVRCASLMIAENEHQIQQQFRHSHPLTVCDNGKKFPLSCYACQLPFNDSIYVCFECRLLLHRSCADLPREFGHPFHPQHPLTLFDEPPYRPFCIIECRACRNSIEGSGYGCVECASEIHIRCALPFPPTIKCEELHQHPLAFFNIRAKVQYNCNACDMLCTAPYFSCVDCRFNLHVGCIPTLPPTVKHVRHRHPLSLTNSPVRDYPDEDDDAEFYCDACEERRNLFDPTYYCAKCHYVAHVQCRHLRLCVY